MENLYDVVIIGGGPAGLTAAIYLARARYRVVVVEKEKFGGQITITSEVVNYPGVLETDGRTLTETMRRQAERFGAEFLMAEVTGLVMGGDVKRVQTGRGELYCFGVLLATGAHPRRVGFEGEETFRGRGVAYCATCGGEFFTDRQVYVIGGGFAAAEESVFLTRYARHVTILMRGEDFRCAQSAAQAARSNDKITVCPTTVLDVSGDTAIRRIRYQNTKSGQITEVHAPDGENLGVFVFAGYEPETSLVRGLAELNPQGYVCTDGNQRTTTPGLYAAGDVCEKNLRQVVTAVGDGAVAATELERLAAQMQKQTGLRPLRPRQEPQQPAAEEAPSSMFDSAVVTQLQAVFAKMQSHLVLALELNDTPVSAELEQYMSGMADLTDKLTVRLVSGSAETERPCVRVLREDGTDTGLAFHGVPGGHEFTSFVMGLYNAAGPGQALEPELHRRVLAIDRDIRLQVLVSLSCTMCPDLVMAAQRIAALNPHVRAEVYDLNHFPALREAYQVMSVPFLVMDGSRVSFGKKTLPQLLDLLDR